ncbi:MAG: hypothetical protein M1834_000524 [Cirrosporium novae-zelandiae]|nr:MAG: hypothetical protein M1834_000524 [Cirrosporium novae-zelandiae]
MERNKANQITAAAVDEKFVEKYSFSSPLFDPGLSDTSSVSCRLKSNYTSSKSASLQVLEIANGECSLQECSALELIDSSLDGSFNSVENTDFSGRSRIVFLQQNPEDQPKVPQTAIDLVRIFEFLRIPPAYLEVLTAYNGIHSAVTSYSEHESTPELFELLISMPAIFCIIGSIYFRYVILTNTTTLFIFTPYTTKLITALTQIYRPSPASHSNPSTPTDLFTIFAIILTQFRTSLDEEHKSLHQEICDFESQTGLIFYHGGKSLPETLRQEYGQLKRGPYEYDGSILLLEWITRFQIGLTEFLLEQHKVLIGLISEHASSPSPLKLETETKTACTPSSPPSLPPHTTQKTISSLTLHFSFLTHNLTHVLRLRNRARIQLNVVESSITQNENLTNISIAESTRKDEVAMKEIAESIRRDRVAMKEIVAVTMAFLPATFVAEWLSIIKKAQKKT